MVESGDAGDGASGGFVESGAVDAVGYGWSIGSCAWVVWADIAQWVGGAQVSELFEDVEGDPPFAR